MVPKAVGVFGDHKESVFSLNDSEGAIVDCGVNGDVSSGENMGRGVIGSSLV